MSIQSYDPEMAEMINKQIKSQANVGICCAVIYNNLDEQTHGNTDKVVPAAAKQLAKETSFSPTQCTVALNTLRQLGLITNLTKNSCQMTGDEGKYQLYRKGMK